MIACTGWTWSAVETEMTFPRWSALQAYYTQHPPAHLLLAALARYKAPRLQTTEEFLAQWAPDQLSKLHG